MSHTKEPWAIDQNYPTDIQSKSEEICSMWARDCREDKAKANARRIVACVNACAGISTELLERGAQNDWAEMMQEMETELLETKARLQNCIQKPCACKYEAIAGRVSTFAGGACKELADYIKQRDELLAALKAAVAHQAYKPENAPDWWLQGQAAIAKAEQS